jgi:hypothetical protein
MANNDSQSKIISARIPMEKYLEILKKAMDLKISVSDYLILKLYDDKKIYPSNPLHQIRE